MNTKDSDILIRSPTAFPLLYSREVGGFGCSLCLLFGHILELNKAALGFSLCLPPVDFVHYQITLSFSLARVQALSKTPIKITEAVYTVKCISYLDSYAHLHFVVSDGFTEVS